MKIGFSNMESVMDLNALKMFISTVQTGSFSASSQKLGVPIATLSRKIKGLEQALNIQLLERSSQGVQPTLLGQQLYENANLSIETLANIRQLLQGDQAQLKGKLRLSMPQAFTFWWDVVEAFQAAYPQIEVHILATNSKLDLLAEGIDVAVRVGDLQTDSLIAKKVGEIRLQLVASRDFVQQWGEPLTPAQLSDFTCVAWSATAESDVQWLLGGQTVRISPKISSNDYHHLRHLALLGKGITDLPDFLAQPLINAGHCIPILPDYPFTASPVHLLYPSHRHPSSLVKAYVEFCQEWFQAAKNNAV